MAFRDVYLRQVGLLIRTIPYTAEENSFALKGGTAINLFVRDMPRLSVDIDLAFIPIAPWAESISAIDNALQRISARIRTSIDGVRVVETRLRGQGSVNKLFVQRQVVQIKIEVTPVLRGSVFAPEDKSARPAVESAFGYAETSVLSFPDLYGGKLVAAMDRQHPRDLFDVWRLMDEEGIDDNLRAAFIVYLLSHDRPMHEVISPRRKDIAQEYERGFAGMTEEEVPLETLLDVRERLSAEIAGNMLDAHKQFLVSFERGESQWDLLGLDSIDKLPAVLWRQQNLAKLAPGERALLVGKLEEALR